MKRDTDVFNKILWNTLHEEDLDYVKNPVQGAVFLVYKIVAEKNEHCVKSVQIRSYFWSVFSFIRIEYVPEITPYLDTFHVMEKNA